MLVLPRGKRALMAILIALFIASFSLSQWGIYNRPSATFFLLPARAWELLLGIFAALYLAKAAPISRTLRTDILSFTGLTLIAVPIFLYDKFTPFPGAYALPATVGTVLVILFARPGTLAHRLLATRPMVAVGLISYSAYLWHQPVFAFFKHRFGSAYFEDWAFALIALSLLLAMLSYRIVETPFRRGATLKHLCVSMTVCFGMIIAATTVLSTLARDRKEIVPSYQWALENASPQLISYIEGMVTRTPCTAEPDALGTIECRFGAADQKPSIVIWGDSLAGALLDGINEAARENSVAGVAYISDGCPPILGLRNTASATCTAATHRAVLDRITALPDVETVLLIGNLEVAMTAANVLIDGSTTSPDLVAQKITQAMQTLRAAGLRTVLIEQGPMFDAHVAEHELQRARNDFEGSQSITRAYHLASIAQTRRLAGAFDTYIKTVDLFCEETDCPSVDSDGNLVVYDRNHVTKTYAQKLAQWVFSALN